MEAIYETNVLTIAEAIREREELLEAMLDAIAQQRLLEINNDRYNLLRDHFIAKLEKCISSTASQLLDYYLEDDSIQAARMSKEILSADAIKAVGNQDAFIKQKSLGKASFEFGNDMRLPPTFFPDIDDIKDLFSKEECHGRALDLRPFMRGFGAEHEIDAETERVRYENFLVRIDERIRELADHDQAFQLISSLHRYLVGFCWRRFPLQREELGQRLRGIASQYSQLDILSVKRKQIEYLLTKPLKDIYNYTLRKVENDARLQPQERQSEQDNDDKQYEKAYREARCCAGLSPVDDEDDNPENEESSEVQVDLPEQPIFYDANGQVKMSWLVKQEGLRKMYHCDICREDFFGTKAFYEHFAQMRHSVSLHRIGVHNSAFYYGVGQRALAWQMAYSLHTRRAARRQREEEMDEMLD